MARHLIVFVTYGSFGDVNPLLAIARCAMSTSAVRFVTNEFYREHVEAAGVPFHAAGTVEEQRACAETEASSGRSFEGLMTQFRNHVGRNIPRLAECLQRWQLAGHSLLVVTHGTINPAFPICEALRIPVVRAYYAPSHIPLNREDYVFNETFGGCAQWQARWVRYPLHALAIRCKGPRHARHEYDRLRMQAGLARSQAPYQRVLRSLIGRASPTLNVVREMLLTPKWFAEPMGKDVAHVRCVGFPFLDAEPRISSSTERAAAEREISELIARFGAPVVFTPGTGVEDMKDFCRPIESVCHELAAPGILLARHGAGTYGQMRRVLNHPVIHVPHADFAWLLPKTKLLVHTGGIGTIAQAIRCGVPQIIHPLFNDQPKNALRVLMNGLGAVLQGEGYASAGIVDLYRHVSSSELHLSCLDHHARQVREEDGAAIAAARLEELAASLNAAAFGAIPPSLPASMTTSVTQ